jgi:DNA-directed RNA polymerase subunit beta'
MVADRGPEAYKALTEAVHERPVLMTRAPSLHKYNIMAFWPVLTKGKHIQISPSIVKPYAADMDGDTVNFYVPTTSAATKEAIEKMMPEHNLINPRFMKAQYKPEAEYQQGIYLMSKPPAGLSRRSFHTKAEAALAYRRGEIGVDEPINVIEK